MIRCIARLVFASIAALLSTQMACAEVRAVVIGISEYRTLQPLPGATPDAKDISTALKVRGFEQVVTLLDYDAQKSRVESAMRTAIDQSASGDTVILSFAGHGALTAADDPSKSKRAFLLADYSAKDKAEERFLDADLRGWATQLQNKGAILVAVLDACHSGVGVRAPPPGGVAVTPARFIAPERALGPIDQSDKIVSNNAYVFGATDGELRVHEALVDGISRGALSYAFARAVEGAIEKSGRSLTAQSMRGFISQVVRNISQNSQTPQFHLPQSQQVLLAPKSRPSLRRTLDKPMTIASLGQFEKGLLTGQQNVTFQPQGTADLLWDPQTRQLRNIYGDAVADDLSVRDFSIALEAQWAYRKLSQLTLEAETLVTKINRDGAILCKGDRFDLTVEPTPFKNVVIFDLSGNGLVQFGYAGAYGSGGQSGANGWTTQYLVDEPFGADYLVVIATNDPVAELEIAIRSIDEKKEPTRLMNAVTKALQGRTYAMSVHERYSANPARFPELCRK